MNGWARYRRSQPCAVCGERKGKCIYDGRIESPKAVGCFYVEKGSISAMRDGLGWIHRLIEDNTPRAPRMAQPPPKAHPYMAELAKECHRRIRPESLQNLAKTLGVAVDSLWRLRIGWCRTYIDVNTGEERECHAWSFPMREGDGHTVNGVRFRNDRGDKWAAPGSLNGIFVPTGLTGRGPLSVVEGPTDTAAALTLGFDAIGRPSNQAGLDYLVTYIRKHPRDVVNVINNDAPGRAKEGTEAGAAALSAKVRGLVSFYVARPQVKDIRLWLNQGCTHGDYMSLISPPSVSKT